MGFSLNERHVRGFLFKPSGKYAHTVLLDYTGLDYKHWNLIENATKALKQAVEKGIAGIGGSGELGDQLILFVPEPFGELSHPITVNLRNAVLKNQD